jgi:hypothetical protein
MLQRLQGEELVRSLQSYIPTLMQAGLSAFSTVGKKGRERLLEMVELCLRSISWADGLEDEVVEECLDETFNQWMAVFL